MTLVARILVLCVAGVPLVSLDSEQDDAALGDPVRGITLSTPTWGREWGEDGVEETMRELRALGATWVAVHPYARIRKDGSVRWRDFDPATPPPYLARPIRAAHDAGLRIFVKPHLAYWGSGFAWRGDIEFDAEEHWLRFWSDYEKWIVAVARATSDADAFAVGTELDRTLQHEDRWRGVVGAVRGVTDAHLTYAANWTDYRRVTFWDALDAIGIQAYFPVADRATADPAELRAGWRETMLELSEYAESVERHVVFTELGYSRSRDAAVEPWDPRVEDESALETQRACLSVALAAIREEPRVVGAFLWKWLPGSHRRDRDFDIQEPTVMETIRASWRSCR